MNNNKLDELEKIFSSSEKYNEFLRDKKHDLKNFFDEINLKKKNKEISKEEFDTTKSNEQNKYNEWLKEIKEQKKEFIIKEKEKLNLLKENFKTKIENFNGSKEEKAKLKNQYILESKVLKNKIKGLGDSPDGLHSKSEYKLILLKLKQKIKDERRADFKKIFNSSKYDKSDLTFWKKLDNYISRYKYGVWESDSIVNLIDVQKYFPNDNKVQHILKDINLKINKGEIVSILGPSGSGKSTLFNIISGLISVEKGDVIVNGQNLTYLTDKERTKFREKNISFVFQRYNLISTLKCRDNILLGSDLNLEKNSALSLKEVSDFLGIEKHLDKFPYQLSGGQQQRISIGRALIKGPKILLADEPTGALDYNTTKETLKSFVDINEKFNTTIFIITHNNEIANMADKIIKVNNGRIILVEEKKRTPIEQLKLDID